MNDSATTVRSNVIGVWKESNMDLKGLTSAGELKMHGAVCEALERTMP